MQEIESEGGREREREKSKQQAMAMPAEEEQHHIALVNQPVPAEKEMDQNINGSEKEVLVTEGPPGVANGGIWYVDWFVFE